MTGDRGLDAIVPGYEPELMSPADFVYWEALYADGTVLRETDGQPYAAIDRSKLSSFRLIHGGEPLIETWPPPGATGRNLVYRRRTQFGNDGRRVIFLLAWMPMGPVFVIDPKAATVREAAGFDPEDAELAPPEPMPGEPNNMLPLQDYLLTQK